MHWSRSLLSLVSKLLFRKKEKLRTPLSVEETTILLSAITYKIDEKGRQKVSDLDSVMGIKPRFVGIVKQNFFCISKKVSHPQSFIPRVTGRIKRTSNSTIINLTYQLFPLTKFFFLTFLMLCTLTSVLLIYKEKPFLFSILPFGIVFSCYLVALANFKIHCKDIRKALEEEFLV